MRSQDGQVAAGLVLAALVALGASATAVQPAAIGFVVSLHGGWQVAGQPVKLGQSISAGSHLTLPANTSYDNPRDLPWSVAVALLDNTTPAVSCQTAATCAMGLQLPTALAGRTTMLDRINAAFHLMSEGPSRYVSLLSRGDQTAASVPDGVAKLDADRVELFPLLSGVAPGTYRLRLGRLATDGTAAGGWMTFSLNWDRSAPSGTVPARLAPGLYSASLVTSTSLDAQSVRESWMLLERAGAYDEAASSYARARTVASAWKAPVTPLDRERFLRAYLAALGSAQ